MRTHGLYFSLGIYVNVEKPAWKKARHTDDSICLQGSTVEGLELAGVLKGHFHTTDFFKEKNIFSKFFFFKFKNSLKEKNFIVEEVANKCQLVFFILRNQKSRMIS